MSLRSWMDTQQQAANARMLLAGMVYLVSRWPEPVIIDCKGGREGKSLPLSPEG